jgi:nudix-type nucleoside diphosphatase (YffH/AdpP family)
MAIRLGTNPRVRIERIETLSDAWYVLRKVIFSWRRSDGTWQRQEREAYDRGNGAAALLHRRDAGTVILVRQFRAPAFLNGHDGMLIEAAAGLLDEADPETAIRKEIEEETGYVPARVEKVFEAFMSPGAVTEKLHFYLAEIDDAERRGSGGGHAHEGEDIEVLEIPLAEALAMIGRGEIADGKTIMLLQHLALQQGTARLG